MSNDALFREVQAFGQPWVWAVVVLAALTTYALVGYRVLWPVLRNRRLGNLPLAAFLIALFAVLLVTAILWAFSVAKLTTEVREDGLYVRFYPLHLSFREISLEGVRSVEAVTYRPLAEYGGWGIRTSSKGMAYNVSDDRGVLITYSDPAEKTLMIGSQRPEELEAALRNLLDQRMP